MAPPMLKPDADVVARAATERAEKLEAEVAALKAELAKKGAAAPVVVRAAAKGTVKYRLKADHYRSGVYYRAGEYIVVTDEVPSKTWERVVEGATPAPVEAAKVGRPSDVAV